MESREIKRVSEGEIVEKGLAIGNTTTEDFDVYISTDGQYSLLNDPQTDQPSGFVSFNETNEFSGKRFQVFEAYAYNAENNLDSEPGIQILEGDTLLLYTKPALFEGKTVGVFYLELSRKEIVLSIKK